MDQPTTQPGNELRPLIERLDQAVQAVAPADQPAAAEAVLRSYLADLDVRRWLATVRLPEIRPHGLWFDPADRFSVVLYEWTLNGASPIHDHWCWGAVAAIDGAEHEELFTLNGQGYVCPTGFRLLTPGETVSFPGGTVGIHRVSCASDFPARSLHIYGGNIARTDLSSIDKVYHEAPAELSVVS